MITKLLALPFLAIAGIIALAAAVVGGLIWLIVTPFSRHVKTDKEDDFDLQDWMDRQW